MPEVYCENLFGWDFAERIVHLPMPLRARVYANTRELFGVYELNPV
jgi:hypothetical protein